MKQGNQIVLAKDLQALNTTLYELTCLRRWSEFIVEGGKYTELIKQSLNCAIAYFWACEVRAFGVNVNFSNFPKIAITRAFQKTFQCDIPEANLEEIFKLGNVSKETFYQKVNMEISKVVSEDFFNHLQYCTNCLEARIYRAATKIATIIELDEIGNGISEMDYKTKSQQIKNSMEEFSNLPGYSQMVSENYLNIFQEISKLRNRIRWAKHPNIIKCSVLGHQFDVAVFAYLMSLEENPLDEDLATHFFFMGIFHDIPERWTGDMPSPVKDSVPGLRKATEEFENAVMEQYVYSLLPGYMISSLKQVMLEEKALAYSFNDVISGDIDSTSLKKFLKKSDNYSAFIECWRELDAGSRHYYYSEVFLKDYAKKEDLPSNFRKLAEVLHDRIFCR